MASVAALSILTAKRSSEKEESFLFLFYRDWSLSKICIFSAWYSHCILTLLKQRDGTEAIRILILVYFLTIFFSQNKTITLFSLLVHTFSVITCHLLLFLNLRWCAPVIKPSILFEKKVTVKKRLRVDKLTNVTTKMLSHMYRGWPWPTLFLACISCHSFCTTINLNSQTCSSLPLNDSLMVIWQVD